MTTDAKRDRIAAIIRALKAKTVANGCTEDEAASAAAMVAAMLAKHNMTEDEAELKANAFAHHREHHEDTVGDRLWKVADGVAHLTGCRYYTSPAAKGQGMNFFGFEHEVEIARYLFEVCAYAMRSERQRLHNANRILNDARRRLIIVPFLDGMADSLRQRLRDMKPPAPTGKGLVVLRGELIDQAMKDAGINTHERATRRGRDAEPSYRAGVAAGEALPLNPGLSGGVGHLRIGGRD